MQKTNKQNKQSVSSDENKNDLKNGNSEELKLNNSGEDSEKKSEEVKTDSTDSENKSDATNTDENLIDLSNGSSDPLLNGPEDEKKDSENKDVMDLKGASGKSTDENLIDLSEKKSDEILEIKTDGTTVKDSSAAGTVNADEIYKEVQKIEAIKNAPGMYKAHSTHGIFEPITRTDGTKRFYLVHLNIEQKLVERNGNKMIVDVETNTETGYHSFIPPQELEKMEIFPLPDLTEEGSFIITEKKASDNI